MLYIIRHGRTDWNNRKKLQGQTDIPLNEEGRAMAAEAAKQYKDIHFDECYCSPLVRAKETAEILLEGREVPVIFDDRLKEMNFGIYEGIEKSFSIPDCPVNVLFQKPEVYEGVEGGESLDAVFERTGELLDEVILPKVHAGKDILIVGHGAMNSTIICRLRSNDRSRLWEEPIDNCRLVRLL